VLTELEDAKNTDTALELLTQLFREEASSRCRASCIIHLRLMASAVLAHHTVDGRNPAPPGMYKTL